jgi:hypothetical protein
MVKKGIPFDRETGMEWQISLGNRIFWPDQLDREFPLNDDGEEVVSVEKIQLIKMAGSYEGQVIVFRNYLDEHFPAYSPLEDYVKDVQSHG